MKTIEAPAIPSFIRLPQVQSQSGIGRTLIYQLVDTGDFPAPRRLGARAVGWLQSEVTDWVIARSRQPPSVPVAPRPPLAQADKRKPRLATGA